MAGTEAGPPESIKAEEYLSTETESGPYFLVFEHIQRAAHLQAVIYLSSTPG